MSTFFAFNPHIQAITADRARSIVAGQIDGGAGRFDSTTAGLLHATRPTFSPN